MIAVDTDGRCGRPGCKYAIGEPRTLTTPGGRTYRVLVLPGRWRASAGVWHRSGREKHEVSGGPGMSPWYAVPPLMLACPRCTAVQVVDGFDHAPGQEPGTLGRMAVRPVDDVQLERMQS